MNKSKIVSIAKEAISSEWKKRIKKIHGEAEDYYHKMKIIPDREEIIDFIVEKLAEDAGIDESAIKRDAIEKAL